jgi:hypothetical protein
MKRAVLIALLALPIACGITYAPGDFLGSATDGGRSDAAPTTSDATQPRVDGSGDSAAPPGGTRVLLLAGRRDGVTGETGDPVTIGETITTTIAPDGTLGAWGFDAPPPAGIWTHAAIAGGQLFVHNLDVVARASFTDHITGAWSSVAITKVPATGVRPWVLDERGLTSGRSIENGGSDQAWAAPYADGGVGAWAHGPAHLSVARGDSTLVRAGNVVYAVGGHGPVIDFVGNVSPTGESAIEAAPLNADGTLGDFVSTTPLPVVGDSGTLFAVNAPIAVASADHLFLLGGLTTPKAASLTDVALGTKIHDPATGAIDPWVLLPRLPQPMTGFAAVVTPTFVFVFGGTDSTGKALDAVLRLPINADGSFGAKWESAGTLPGGRAGIVAVTY